MLFMTCFSSGTNRRFQRINTAPKAHIQNNQFQILREEKLQIKTKENNILYQHLESFNKYNFFHFPIFFYYRHSLIRFSFSILYLNSCKLIHLKIKYKMKKIYKIRTSDISTLLLHLQYFGKSSMMPYTLRSIDSPFALYIDGYVYVWISKCAKKYNFFPGWAVFRKNFLLCLIDFYYIRLAILFQYPVYICTGWIV